MQDKRRVNEIPRRGVLWCFAWLDSDKRGVNGILWCFGWFDSLFIVVDIFYIFLIYFAFNHISMRLFSCILDISSIFFSFNLSFSYLQVINKKNINSYYLIKIKIRLKEHFPTEKTCIEKYPPGRCFIRDFIVFYFG